MFSQIKYLLILPLNTKTNPSGRRIRHEIKNTYITCNANLVAVCPPFLSRGIFTHKNRSKFCDDIWDRANDDYYKIL